MPEIHIAPKLDFVLTAAEVAKMLNLPEPDSIPGEVVLASGYTFEREDLEVKLVWTTEDPENCFLVRKAKIAGIDIVEASYSFCPWFFERSVKRFYEDTVPEALIKLFATFGTTLSLTRRF